MKRDFTKYALLLFAAAAVGCQDADVDADDFGGRKPELIPFSVNVGLEDGAPDAVGKAADSRVSISHNDNKSIDLAWEDNDKLAVWSTAGETELTIDTDKTTSSGAKSFNGEAYSDVDSYIIYTGIDNTLQATDNTIGSILELPLHQQFYNAANEDDCYTSQMLCMVSDPLRITSGSNPDVELHHMLTTVQLKLSAEKYNFESISSAIVNGLDGAKRLTDQLKLLPSYSYIYDDHSQRITITMYAPDATTVAKGTTRYIPFTAAPYSKPMYNFLIVLDGVKCDYDDLTRQLIFQKMGNTPLEFAAGTLNTITIDLDNPSWKSSHISDTNYPMGTTWTLFDTALNSEYLGNTIAAINTAKTNKPGDYRIVFPSISTINVKPTDQFGETYKFSNIKGLDFPIVTEITAESAFSYGFYLYTFHDDFATLSLGTKGAGVSALNPNAFNNMQTEKVDLIIKATDDANYTISDNKLIFKSGEIITFNSINGYYLATINPDIAYIENDTWYISDATFEQPYPYVSTFNDFMAALAKEASLNRNSKTLVFPKLVDLPVISFYGINSTNNRITIELPVANSIGAGAFNGSLDIISINAPKATTIYFDAFKDCSNLQSLSLGTEGAGITEIDRWFGDYGDYEATSTEDIDLTIKCAADRVNFDGNPNTLQDNSGAIYTFKSITLIPM